jgi:hypothetical protein
VAKLPLVAEVTELEEMVGEWIRQMRESAHEMRLEMMALLDD